MRLQKFNPTHGILSVRVKIVKLFIITDNGLTQLVHNSFKILPARFSPLHCTLPYQVTGFSGIYSSNIRCIYWHRKLPSATVTYYHVRYFRQFWQPSSKRILLLVNGVGSRQGKKLFSSLWNPNMSNASGFCLKPFSKSTTETHLLKYQHRTHSHEPTPGLRQSSLAGCQ